MANIQLKRSAVQGRVPTTTDLELGELGLNTYDGKIYMKKNDGTESVIEVGGSATLTVDSTAPSNPTEGVLWYDTETARLFIWTSTEWADASPDAANATVITSDAAPATPVDGDLWYRTSDGRMYVYYDDGTTSQWVDANPNLPVDSDTWDRTGSNVTLKNSGDKVGIGASTPGTALHIANADAGIRLEDTDGSATAYSEIKADTSASLILDADPGNAGGSSIIGFNVDGSEAARIDSSGNVGIGTTSINAKLEISGNSGGRGFRLSDGEVLDISAGASANDPARIATSSGSGIQFAVNGTSGEHMRLDSSGRLLVGTSSSSSNNSVVIEGYSGSDSGQGILTLAKGSSSPANGNVLGAVEFTDSGHVASANIVGRRDGGTWTSGSSQPSRLVFSTTADGSSSVTERMRIDSSGNVGIGRTPFTSPAGYPLQLRGGSQVFLQMSTSGHGDTATDGLSIGADGSTAYIIQRENSPIAIYTNNTERMRIDSSGNVGIGTTSPSSFANFTNLTLQGGTSGSNLDFFNSSGVRKQAIVANASNGLSIEALDVGDINFNTNNTERVRIDSSGRLLVGTSTARSLNSDIQLLQVEAADGSGTGRIAIGTNNNDNATGAGIYLFRSRAGSLNGNTIVNDGDDLGSIYFHGADGNDMDSRAAQIRCEVDGTPGSNDMPGRLVFSTTADGASSPTERMRIDSAGRVSLSNGRLYVQASTGSPLCFVYNTNNTSTDITYRSDLGAGSNGTSAYHFYAETGGSGKFAIYGNGTYGTISDERLKTHIEPARTGYLDDLNRLNIVKYGWKIDELDHATELGVIAQDVETVFPGLIQDTPPNEDGETFKGVKTSVFTFMLIKALQEASAKIETLEQRLSDAGIA